MSDIPPETLTQLHAGSRATASLVELLAVDQATLAQAVFGRDHPATIAAHAVASAGIMDRLRAIGAALSALPERTFAHHARHPSDIVRSWLCFAVAGRPNRTLPRRLSDLRAFAADDHFGVREIAWMALRPNLARDLPRALILLEGWARDANPNLRRCASEATRPRGVWCAHLPSLIADPTPAEPLLTILAADPHKYVQTSVGNWLNDAGKSQPEWVRMLTARWLQASPSPATAWIVRHGCRRLTR